MHEASLINDLMQKILAVAADQDAERVAVAQVWLGALSHMSADHFRGHFEIAAAGTIAAGAALRIEISEDLDHPDAQHLLLQSIEVEG
jgi:hydrogenase nickel incorporation protein HypA/HybF